MMFRVWISCSWGLFKKRRVAKYWGRWKSARAASLREKPSIIRRRRRRRRLRRSPRIVKNVQPALYNVALFSLFLAGRRRSQGEGASLSSRPPSLSLPRDLNFTVRGEQHLHGRRAFSLSLSRKKKQHKVFFSFFLLIAVYIQQQVFTTTVIEVDSSFFYIILSEDRTWSWSVRAAADSISAIFFTRHTNSPFNLDSYTTYFPKKKPYYTIYAMFDLNFQRCHFWRL